MKKITISTILAAMLLTSTTQAGTLTGGATVFQQIFDIGQNSVHFAKQVEEMNRTYKQFVKWKEEMIAYKQLLNNLGSFPKNLKAQFMKELLQMKKAVEFGDALSYTAASFDQDFKSQFKGYDQWLKLAKGGDLDFQETYKQLNDTSRDTIKGAMKALQFQEKDLKSDASFMKAVHSKMSTAKGEKEMLLIANELAIHQAERIKSLQKTIMTQANMQGQYYAKKNEESTLKDATFEAFKSKVVLPDSTDNKPMP